ncbi:MAG: hypothetical protein AAGB12_15695 [Pseudomonadota bacterium]
MNSLESKRNITNINAPNAKFKNDRVAQYFEKQLRILMYECRNLDVIQSMSTKQIIEAANLAQQQNDQFLVKQEVSRYRQMKRIMLKVDAEKKRKHIRDNFRF